MGESYPLRPRDPVSLLLKQNPGKTAQEIVTEKVAELQRTMHHAGAIGTKPPFSPDRMARQLGIPIKDLVNPDLGFEACLMALPGDRWKILVNTTNRSANRRRFSVAHELVHTLFPEAEATAHYRLNTGFDANHELERLVDFGAAQLLMPPKLFAADIEECGLGLETLFRLSNKYQVSLQAAAVNMIRHAQECCGVVFCSFSFRPSSGPEGAPTERKKWRVERAFTSPHFPCFIHKGYSFGEKSVVAKAARIGKNVASVVTLGVGDRFLEGCFMEARPLAHRRFEPPVVVGLIRPGSRKT